MTVDTKKVEGRRDLHFENLDDLRSEVNRLSESRVEQLGNWNLAQAFEHLARSMNMVYEEIDYHPPIYLRMAGPLMKRVMVKKPLRAGFKPPKEFDTLQPPSDVPLEDARRHLLKMIDRFEATENFPKHVFLGKMTKEQYIGFTLRHAELHLSFQLPQEPAA